jgi:AcrR family transcriptional regulator
MAEDLDARTRIREIALERFGRQGVRDTSTREILKAAGMKNPSAITYHFGSKAKLVEDLVAELIEREAPVLQRQIELAARATPPTIDEWVAIAVDSASALISTERGCLLARLWWEYDGYLRPEVFEEFLASGSDVANRWLDAVDATFPDLPRYMALTRNVTMLRTLEWMIARRANRLLIGRPSPALQMDDPAAFRQLMLEVATGIVTAPTVLGDDDIRFDR